MSTKKVMNNIGSNLLLDNLQLARSVLGKRVLVLVPKTHQFIDVLLVNLVDVVVVGMLVLNHSDWASNNNVDWSAIRHHSDVVVKDAASVEYRNSETHKLLDQHLEFVDVGMRFGIDLVVDVVFAECKDGYEIGTGANSHLDETFAATENELDGSGARIERFTGTSNDNGNGAAHTFVVGASL